MSTMVNFVALLPTSEPFLLLSSAAIQFQRPVSSLHLSLFAPLI